MSAGNVSQLMNEMRHLVVNLQHHEQVADVAVSKSQIVNEKITGMKEYQEEIANMNDCWRMRGRKALVAGLQQENRQILLLQQENRELRQILEDCECTLQLIMQKHRDIVSRLMAEITKPQFSNRVARANQENTMDVKIVDFSRHLDNCFVNGETASNNDQEVIAQLVKENECLRQLLKISSQNFASQSLKSVKFTAHDYSSDSSNIFSAVVNGGGSLILKMMIPIEMKHRRLLVHRLALGWQKLRNINLIRCDIKGIDWLAESFSENGCYMKFHSQMPNCLHQRADGNQNYKFDPPITERGLKLSSQAGCRLNASGLRVDAVYSSPSLRCIQTTQKILDGLQQSDLCIQIEPGLYQWTRWCNKRMPVFLNASDMASVIKSVNIDYKPIHDINAFDMDESLFDYYERSRKVVAGILNKERAGVVLCVGHAGTLEMICSSVCRKNPPNEVQFMLNLQKTSYLSNLLLDESLDGTWINKGSAVGDLIDSGLDRCEV